MVIFGRVINELKKSSVQDASVTIVNNGIVEAARTTTDEVGRFSLSSDKIKLGSVIRIEHPNYFAAEVTFSGISDLGFIPILEKPAQRVPVEPVADNSNWLVYALIAGVVLLALKKRKKSG